MFGVELILHGSLWGVSVWQDKNEFSDPIRHWFQQNGLSMSRFMSSAFLNHIFLHLQVLCHQCNYISGVCQFNINQQIIFTSSRCAKCQVCSLVIFSSLFYTQLRLNLQSFRSLFIVCLKSINFCEWCSRPNAPYYSCFLWAHNTARCTLVYCLYLC